MSADTVIPGQSDKAGAGNPQELNRYSYVNNNPIRYTDPSGHRFADVNPPEYSGMCSAGIAAMCAEGEPRANGADLGDGPGAGEGRGSGEGNEGQGSGKGVATSGATTEAPEGDPNSSETKGDTAQPKTLYHYTDEAGEKGITDSEQLNPSLKENNPKDARYGDGPYLSDITPGSKTPAQLPRAFLGQPYQGARFTHFVEINVEGLSITQGRPGVYVHLSTEPLDLSSRIVSSGKVQ